MTCCVLGYQRYLGAYRTTRNTNFDGEASVCCDSKADSRNIRPVKYLFLCQEVLRDGTEPPFNLGALKAFAAAQLMEENIEFWVEVRYL